MKKVSVRDQIERVAGRIAAFQWYVDHPRMEDGRCRFCGTTAASCPCIGNTKRNLIYWEKRLAVLRAETTLTPKEVEGILKGGRRMVKKRERDEMAERVGNAQRPIFPVGKDTLTAGQILELLEPGDASGADR